MTFPYLPIEDSISAPFWEGTRAEELRLQKCTMCSKFQHYPRALCSHCGHTILEWQKVSGRGIIDTWTEVMRAPQEGFEAPYVIARVRLAEGPIMLSRIDVSSSEVSCDQPVVLKWQHLSDGRALPLFVPQGG
ncbi:MAG: hypothetical protein EBU43_02830 [Actinobacteria bacterium]|nr:hypothetical protein [Actinomycetota bacterium]